MDFVSTHAYADDTVENLFGNDSQCPWTIACAAPMAKVRDQIDASAAAASSPLLTEWNVQGEDESRDTIFVGPAVANTIRECEGTSTDVVLDLLRRLRGGRPDPAAVYRQFGLRAKGGINKPSYYGFALLHRLGDERLPAASDNVLATKTANGNLAVAAWDLFDPGAPGWGKDGPPAGPARTLTLVFRGVPANARVTIATVDRDHGNVLPKYRAMGSPEDPTPAQVKELNQETALPPPTVERLTNGRLTLTLTPDALDLVTVERGSQ